jgi:protein involved in polysaccharide export with SLBB domain
MSSARSRLHPWSRGGIFVILALAWSGCGFLDEPRKPRHTAVAVHSADLSSYEFAPGDQIRILTLEHKDLSVETAVADDGTIEMPLIGTIKVTGLTVSRLRDVVAQALDKDFIVDPKVNVEILKYRPFYVLGEVKAPGGFEYQAGMDVRKAVALAGGYTRRASQDSIEITRPVLGKKRSFPGRKDTRVLPGDVIEIERRWF